MKKVSLTQYTQCNGIYNVYLGNGQKKQFKSEREAKKFLSDTSTYLTNTVFTLQNLHKEVFCHYLNNWAYFDNDKQTQKFDLRNNDRIAQHKLNDVQKYFNLIIERCNYTNGNIFSFHHIKTICDCLNDVMNILIWLHNQRAARRELYTYQEIVDRIQLIKYSINNYSNPNNVLLKIAA